MRKLERRCSSGEKGKSRWTLDGSRRGIGGIGGSGGIGITMRKISGRNVKTKNMGEGMRSNKGGGHEEWGKSEIGKLK